MGSKRAKLPKTVFIGPLTWKIERSTQAFNAVKVSIEDHGVVGTTQLEQLTISVKPDLPLSLERETIMHELIHACYATAGSPLGRAKDDEVEEVSVSALSPAILGLLRDNPDLADYLLDV